MLVPALWVWLQCDEFKWSHPHAQGTVCNKVTVCRSVCDGSGCCAAPPDSSLTAELGPKFKGVSLIRRHFSQWSQDIIMKRKRSWGRAANDAALCFDDAKQVSGFMRADGSIMHVCHHCVLCRIAYSSLPARLCFNVFVYWAQRQTARCQILLYPCVFLFFLLLSQQLFLLCHWSSIIP